MKTILKNVFLFVFFIFITISCSSQDTHDATTLLKERFRNTNFHELLFLEEELIVLCADSMYQNSFIEKINRREKAFSIYINNEIKENNVLFYLLCQRVQNADAVNEDKNKSKQFIMNLLKPYSTINFVVDEYLLIDLFDYSKRNLATMEDCDVSISNFIFFIYDPLLYVKVIKNYQFKNYIPARKAHFIPCSLENPDYQVMFKMKMKEGLLAMLKEYNQPEIIKIRKEIEEADLNLKYD